MLPQSAREACTDEWALAAVEEEAAAVVVVDGAHYCSGDSIGDNHRYCTEKDAAVDGGIDCNNDDNSPALVRPSDRDRDSRDNPRNYF